MQLVEWKDEFRTGFASVDHEHQTLLHMLNEIAEQVSESADHETIQEFLGEVYAQIKAHFAHEEQLMQEIGYDEYAQHKAEHDRLLAEIQAILAGHFEGRITYYRDELSTRLRDWFAIHFKTMDPRLHRMLK